MVSLKGGLHGASLVTEHKHGRVLQREFVFWEWEPFEGHLVQAGFRVIAFETSMRGTTGGQPTQWLRVCIKRLRIAPPAPNNGGARGVYGLSYPPIIGG